MSLFLLYANTHPHWKIEIDNFKELKFKKCWNQGVPNHTNLLYSLSDCILDFGEKKIVKEKCGKYKMSLILNALYYICQIFEETDVFFQNIL